MNVKELQRLFDYDPETGVLRWAVSEGRKIKGVELKHSQVRLGETQYKKSRICFAIAYGYWPKGLVDHINRNNTDNRKENLREATHRQNQFNRCDSGFYGKGVVKKEDTNRAKPYTARIRIDGKRVGLGHFATRQEAEEAYKAAAKEYQGEFAYIESKDKR